MTVNSHLLFCNEYTTWGLGLDSAKGVSPQPFPAPDVRDIGTCFGDLKLIITMEQTAIELQQYFYPGFRNVRNIATFTSE